MFTGLLRLVLFVACTFIVLGLLNFIHPALDSLAQFRLHALAGLLVVVVIACLAQLWISVGLSLVVGLVSFALTWPQLAVEASSGKPQLKVVQFNLWFRNDDRQAAGERLQQADADVLILQELVGRDDPLVQRLRKTHPHGIICTTRQRPGNVAVLSRLPLASDRKAYCDDRKAYAQVGVVWQGTTVMVASLHLSWPWPFGQHRQVTELREIFDALPDGPLVLAGDFNSAAWTHTLARMAQRVSGHVAPNSHFTWGPEGLRSWGRWGQIVSLDQAVLRALKLVDRQLLAPAGSDHRPILLTLEAQP